MGACRGRRRAAAASVPGSEDRRPAGPGLREHHRVARGRRPRAVAVDVRDHPLGLVSCRHAVALSRQDQLRAVCVPPSVSRARRGLVELPALRACGARAGDDDRARSALVAVRRGADQCPEAPLPDAPTGVAPVRRRRPPTEIASRGLPSTPRSRERRPSPRRHTSGTGKRPASISRSSNELCHEACERHSEVIEQGEAGRAQRRVVEH